MADILKKIKIFLGLEQKPPVNSAAPKQGSSQSVKEGPEPLQAKAEFLKIFAPVDGKVVEQKDIPDEAFSQGHMGVGVGIDPSSSDFKIFMDGEIAVIYKTKHAYFLKQREGDISVMLHIGIDTVKIDESKGTFQCSRAQGEIVKVGEALCDVNLQIVREDAISTITPILVQNEGMEGKKVIFHKPPGSTVRAGDLLMSVVAA